MSPAISVHRLVASATGTIEILLLSLPAGFVTGNAELCATLVTRLAPTARLLVVTHQASAPQVTRLAADRRRTEVLAVPDSEPLSIWCQDAITAWADGGDTAIAPSARPAAPGAQRAPARVIHDRLVEAGIASRHDDGLPVRSGNMLVGDDLVLVGADEWRRWNDDALHGGGAADGRAIEGRAAGFFATVLDAVRRPVVLGGGGGRNPGPSRVFTGPDGERWRENTAPAVVERNSLQPVYHVDLYVTLAGNVDGVGAAVVGDPSLCPPPGASPVEPDLQAAFDAAAVRLVADGLRVIRCPLPLLRRDDPVARRRQWHYASYNNALVENAGPGARRVYMPAFGDLGDIDLALSDRCARDTWERLGFTVVEVDGLDPVARMGGGLHCIAKVLARSEPARSR